MSLLDLIPGVSALKSYLALGAITGLLAGVIWFADHERHVEEVKIAAAEAKATAKQIALDQKDIADARQALTALQAHLDTALATPVHDPVPRIRVCAAADHQDPPPRPDASGSPGVPEPVGPSAPVADAGGAGQGVDITDLTETILSEAGARITYLQGYIRECQAKGFCEATP